MKYRIQFLIVAFVCLFTAKGFSQQAGEPQVIDKVVAVIGKNIIKYSDVEAYYLQAKAQSGGSASLDRCKILETFLLNKLLLQQAYLDSATVDNQMIEATVDERVRAMISYYGSKEVVEKESGKTINEIKEQYKDLYRENMLIQQTQRSLTSSVKVTPKDVTAYFEKIPADSLPIIPTEYEICEIMKIPEVNFEERENVRNQLNVLRERILKGESFSTLATLYSQDPASAKNGGELGFFSRGDMVTEFETAAFGLLPGEVSPVTETKYGFHIIQMIEKRGDMLNARHILLRPKVSPYDLQNAKNQLDSIANLIKSGTYTFDKAAFLFSDSPTKNNGGLVSNPETATSKFTDVVAKNYFNYDISNLAVGDLSPVLPTKDELQNDCYRVLYLKTKVPEHKANLKDDYNRIYQEVLQEAQMEELSKWCVKKKDKVYIKINEPFKDCEFDVDWTNKRK